MVYSQVEKMQESGIKSASFGVFSEVYDTYQNTFFYGWRQSSANKLSVFTGINDTTLNIACAGYFNSSLYGAFSYTEKITNYKWWPQNMTDESWTFLLAWNDFAVKGGYYDFCYSGGKGTAQPYLFLSKKWNKNSNYFAVTVGFDVAMQFASGSKMDVYQNQFHLLAFYGKDINNGINLEYKLMGTYAAKHNVTDVIDVPFFHKILCDYGKVWNLSPGLNLGIHPEIFTRINSINTTTKLHNFIPVKNQFDFYFSFPLSLEYFPGIQDYFSIITSVKIDTYYASFNHLGYKGLGGNNYKGWVPGIGLGFGFKFNFFDKGSLNFGFNYTACPELTDDLNVNEYYMEEISVLSLLRSPITVSLILKI